MVVLYLILNRIFLNIKEFHYKLSFSDFVDNFNFHKIKMKQNKPIVYGSIKRGIVSSDLLEERAK